MRRTIRIFVFVFLIVGLSACRNNVEQLNSLESDSSSLSPVESSIPSQSQPEVDSFSNGESIAKQKTNPESEHLRYPFVKYRKIEDYGPEHVIKEIRFYNENRKTIDEYPELKSIWNTIYEREAERLAINDDFGIDGLVAEYDLNSDGQNDYIIQITSFYFGQTGGYYTVVLRQPDETLKEIQTDNWVYRGELAVMGSKTNGLYDLAQGSTRYHQLIQYDGADKYVKSNPELPHIEKVLCSTDNWDIKGNKLIVEYFNVEISGAGSADDTLYYIGMVSEPLSDYLIDSVLWACDIDYNFITINELAYGTTLHFVGELKHPGITVEEIRELLPKGEFVPNGYLFDDDMFIVVSDD